MNLRRSIDNAIAAVMPFGKFGLMACVMGALAAASLPVRGAELETFNFGPVGKVRVTRPSLSWKVRPAQGTTIIGVSFKLNDSPVEGRYAVEDSVVIAELKNPLSPGNYSVTCEVSCGDGTSIHNDWKFTIAPDAVNDLPPPSAGQQRAWNHANTYRKLIGLPAFRLDSRLCAAAAAHSAYLHQHDAFTHEEFDTLAGFTGARPEDRIGAYGYANSAYEDLVSATGSSDSMVDALFDAPYHRVPFLQPGTPDFGVSIVGEIATLEFGATDAVQMVNYPVDGQQGVPCVFGNNEQPDPLRMHGADGATGYVVTLFYFSPSEEHVKIKKAELTTKDGHAVSCYINTPANDDMLKNGVLIIPKQALKPATTYTADVEAVSPAGEDLARRWSFTTAGKLPPVVDDALVTDPKKVNVPKQVTVPKHAHAASPAPKRVAQKPHRN